MGFIKKIWKDRISEFPTRRSLTKTDGTSELVTVARSEGMISEEGDAFSAENMNDFENRVANGFSELNENLTFPDGTGFYPDEQDGQKGYNTSPNRGADTFFPFSKGVEFTHFIAASQDKSLYGSISFDKDYPVVIVTGRGNKSISIKLSEAGVEQPASYSATNGDFYCCVYKNVKKENVLSYSLVGVSSTFTTMVNVAY